jgi:glucose/mannose transport system substrate-binding protein
MGEQWTAMHLMETIFLATLGPDAYNGLWDGTTDWGSAEVTTAIENYATVLGYVNSDASALTWQDASQLVVNGDAAFNVMGDWAEGYFKELGLSPDSGTDFGWMPVPGTQGSFQFLSDSFVLAVGAPDREAALAWLNICGSQAGQDAFNPVKGSIPARSDADVSLYDTYLQSAMADWASNTIVGSLTHGVVANDSWKTLINDALGVYLTDTTAVETFQASLVTACQTAGPCQ